MNRHWQPSAILANGVKTAFESLRNNDHSLYHTRQIMIPRIFLIT